MPDTPDLSELIQRAQQARTPLPQPGMPAPGNPANYSQVALPPPPSNDDNSPPPGVSPGVYQSLSPAGKAQAWQSAQAHAAPPPPSPQQEANEAARQRSASATSVFQDAGTIGHHIFEGNSAGQKFDESGGKLVDKSKPEPEKQIPTVTDPKNVILGKPGAGGSRGGGGSGGAAGGAAGPMSRQQRIIEETRSALFAPGGVSDRTRAATQQLGDIKAQAADDESKLRQVEATEAWDQHKEQVAMAAEQKQQSLQKLNQLEAERQQYAQMQVDPDHFSKNMGTGQKILAGIGLIFGGFSGARGAPNQAVGIVENAINRDIAAQQANIAVKGHALEAGRGIYHDMLAKFQNDQAASAASKITMLDYAKRRAAALASKYDSPMIKKQNDLMQAALDEKIANQYLQFEAAVTPKPVGGGGSAVSKKDQESAKYISEKMMQAGIPDAETALDAAQRAYAPGAVGDSQGAAGNWLYDKSPWLYSAAPGTSDQDVAAKQSYSQAKNEFIHTMTGSGMGVEEAQRYANTLEGNGSPEARRRGLSIMSAKVQAAKANIRAGATEGGQAAYDERLKAQKSNAPPGSDEAKYGGKVNK